MAKKTKAAMVAEFPALTARADLLNLYLFDTQNGREADATEIEMGIRGQLYRASSATGGYAVIWHIPDSGQMGDAHIRYLDEWQALLREHLTEHTLSLRVVLERLTIARQRIIDALPETHTHGGNCLQCGADTQRGHYPYCSQV